MNGFERILIGAVIILAIGAFAVFSFYLAILLIPILLVAFILFGGLGLLSSLFAVASDDATVTTTFVKINKDKPDIIDAQYEIIDKDKK